MNWPSENVPFGGILHPPKVKYNPATRDFIKILLDEQKQTMTQRNNRNYFLRNGESFPPTRSPGKSRSTTQMFGNRRPPSVTIRPGPSQRRSFDTIKCSGAYERDRFKPVLPRVDREAEKQRLVDKMAFGNEERRKVPKKAVRKSQSAAELNRFDELVAEIQEREEFLAQMEAMGEGKKYKPVIDLQIQERVREMERLQLEPPSDTCGLK